MQFKFPEPYYLLPDVLAGTTHLGGQAWQGLYGMGGLCPGTLPETVPPQVCDREELDKKIKEAKFDNWVTPVQVSKRLGAQPRPAGRDAPGRPTRRSIRQPGCWSVIPYSIWVDTAGNQLPYIDKVVMTLAENLEVLNLRAIAGEYDFQERHVDLGKVPVFLDNQQRGGYKLYLDPGDYGGDMIIKFNLSYEADPEIAKWMNTADFRRALALGIDRNQINETFWLGTGTPSSVVPADHNKYNPGPEYRTRWATL